MRYSPRPVPALFFAALVFSAALFLSCSGGWNLPFGDAGVQRLRLSLPLLPRAWDGLGDLSFILEWKGATGGYRSAHLSHGSTIYIELERGRPQALVAKAYIAGLPESCGEWLASAGALYPIDVSGDPFSTQADGELTLDWHGGWMAECASELASRGLDPFAWDMARLESELKARLTDPWVIHPSKVACHLASGSFRVNMLEARTAFPVTLPGQGPWFFTSPLALPCPTGASAVPLPPGRTILLGRDCSLLVSVDEGGAWAWVRRPYQVPAPADG